MDRKLIGLFFLFFMSFAVFSTIIVFNRPLTSLTRAREDTNPDPKESIVVIDKSGNVLRADGQEEATITVFIRNASKRNLMNKPVQVSASVGIIREGVTNTTEAGAKFHLTSTTPGSSVITVQVNDGTGTVTLDQKPTIEFQ